MATVRLGDMEYQFDVPVDGLPHRVEVAVDCGIVTAFVDDEPVPTFFRPALDL